MNKESIGTDFSYKLKYIWKYVALHIFIHLAGLYGLFLVPSAHYLSLIWAVMLWFSAEQGLGMGAHRLYSHRSYKATFPVRLVLVFFHIISGQFSIFKWVKDHRVHHQYSDTDADPHNPTRGFFYAHYGWLITERHPKALEKLRKVDLSDLKADKLVMFQKKHFVSLHLLFSVVIPAAIPMYFWNESFKHALFVCYFLRMVVLIHCVLTINSIAHSFGNKPYDKSMGASDQSFMNYFTSGEGYHNYHHTFPWDYKSGEFGKYLNLSARFIEILAYFGLTYDLKSPSPEMVKARVLRTGDGSHPIYKKET